MNSKKFRRQFFFYFYFAMVLFRTFLCRTIWINPLSNVIGVWGIYKADGTLYTENIENFILFVPFTILSVLIWTIKNSKQSFTFAHIIWGVLIFSFFISLSIEFLQLLFKVGTWQLFDLFFNTLGGLIGGIIYWVAYKLKHRKDKL